MNNTILLMTDSYKMSHYLQYPEKTTEIESYIESRGGKHKEQIFFGLQIFLKKYLSKPITITDVHEAKQLMDAHGVPFNYEGWKHIAYEHDGYLPLEIKAVPEGTKVPNKNVLVVVKNTDPKCFWLTSYVETALLRAVWYGTTVATISHNIRNIIYSSLEKTSDIALESLPFKLHDFGARGASSHESAEIGGAAHLVNFKGTDTIEGALCAMKYYNSEMPGYSIPATEHSTITAWKRSFEIDAYKNVIEKFGKDGAIYACVSDSYNLWNALELWKSLENDIIEKGGTLVIRPDSGDPVNVPVSTIESLMDLFGSRYNKKGYRVLPDYIRVIQGDGIDEDSIRQILEKMEKRGLSADNIAFGMGGALLQHCDRDTYKFAMKCSSAVVNGKQRNIYKDPITQPDKKSKKGKLGLFKNSDGKIVTLNVDNNGNPLEDGNFEDLLQVVFLNGKIVKEYNFDEVRKNANK